jgi:hypothetical protein
MQSAKCVTFASKAQQHASHTTNNRIRHTTHWTSPTSVQTNSTNPPSRATVSTNINMYQHIHMLIYTVCMCDEHGGSRNDTPHNPLITYVATSNRINVVSRCMTVHMHTQTNTTPVLRHSSGFHGMAFGELATLACTLVYNCENRIVHKTPEHLHLARHNVQPAQSSAPDRIIHVFRHILDQRQVQRLSCDEAHAIHAAVHVLFLEQHHDRLRTNTQPNMCNYQLRSNTIPHQDKLASMHRQRQQVKQQIVHGNRKQYANYRPCNNDNDAEHTNHYDNHEMMITTCHEHTSAINNRKLD